MIIGVDEEDDDEFFHYGTLRRSGRYPWGSGGNPSKATFLGQIADLRAKGLTDSQIAEGFGMNSTQFRALNSIAKSEKKAADIAQAQRLKATGMSNMAIGKEMHINESSVRSLLAPGQAERADTLKSISDMLKKEVDEKQFVDVGSGNENHLGISKDKLNTALFILKEEGYQVIPVQADQLGTAAGNKTLIKVLAPPGTEYKDIVTNLDKIQTLVKYSNDGGKTFSLGIQTPLNISSKRVGIKYKEDGGADADGVIYVREGVHDLSLGNARYAQVRIAIDGSHYLKGMAMYKEGLPKGVDLVFNTNKSDTGNKLDAMKPLKVDKTTGKIDADNPFGAIVRQLGDMDHAGNVTKVTSAMNIVNEQGDWEKWKKSISSQVLSKQSPKLAKAQLDMAYEAKKNELDAILALTNPTVRKKLLETYASSAESASIQLKAAALPRQRSHVILPIDSLKDSEIYAPNYRNGERVALIRYPHGGTFEIPELTVNNNHRESKSLLGRARDAVGINSRVAERLSGADFDGDTVLVIPNPINNPLLKTQPALAGLKKFDAKAEYPKYEGMKVMDAHTKGFQMGDISNLITDMTIAGAPTSELARAVRHSMVVIDAEKHELNWKESARVNGIAQLKTKYQGKANAGASTLISRATSRIDVDKRKPRPASEGGPVDKATGKLVYVPTGESYVQRKVNKRTGEITEKTIFKKQRSVKLAETDDAHTLVSKDGGTPIERVYADHSNRMKSLANQARKEAVNTKNPLISLAAKKTYANEVTSLNAKLNVALMNRPLERQAQVIAGATVAMKKAAAPDMDAIQEKKIKAQALTAARIRTGAQKQQIELTPREWEAIQAGAISNTKLKDILDNSKIEQIKELATPRQTRLMSSTKTNRARQMLDSGYTQAEVADALGVSLTTLKEGLG